MKTKTFYKEFFESSKNAEAWMLFADNRIGTSIDFLDGKMFESPLLLDDGIFEQWFITVRREK